MYKYKCVLQPINMFGGHIVDPGEDADEQEIEFVPAWIDETDDTYGRCLFLDFDGYDDIDTSGTTFIGGMDAFKEQVDSTLYQPLPVQMLSNGESDGKTEYYDKIYLAWWDGAAPYTGKLPFPYVDSVIIEDDWSGYRMPHCNLRINDRTSSLNRAYTAINAKKKTTFKFLADELPNPRSTFLIRGKRYICENNCDIHRKRNVAAAQRCLLRDCRLKPFALRALADEFFVPVNVLDAERHCRARWDCVRELRHKGGYHFLDVVEADVGLLCYDLALEVGAGID